MLSTLSSATLSTVIIALMIASSVVAWIVDEILDDRAFGVMFNTLFIGAGALGGLFVFDHLILTHQLPLRFLNPYGWLTAGAGGATSFLLLFCGLRAAVGR